MAIKFTEDEVSIMDRIKQITGKVEGIINTFDSGDTIKALKKKIEKRDDKSQVLAFYEAFVKKTDKTIKQVSSEVDSLEKINVDNNLGMIILKGGALKEVRDVISTLSSVILEMNLEVSKIKASGKINKVLLQVILDKDCSKRGDKSYCTIDASIKSFAKKVSQFMEEKR